MTALVSLDRTFTLLDTERKLDDGAYSNQIGVYQQGNLKWNDLYSKHLVVILAEAGAGKTIETEESARNLRSQGKFAFFLRLEHLASKFSNAFDIGDITEFKTWKESDQPAWFFLDSVDEARLLGAKQFESAIRSFASELNGALSRAHIFITSRVTEWRASTDFDLIKDKLIMNNLKKRKEDTSGLLGANVKRISGSKQIEQEQLEKPSPFICSLNSLNLIQIRTFATWRNLDNVNNFIDAIKKAEAEPFAGRPQDLDDLIAYWKKHSRIGSRSELIKNSLEVKLLERDPERAKENPLAPEKAMQGSQTLAAATVLQKQSRILVLGATDSEALNPEYVLGADWQVNNVSALLSRAIFDAETYGSVRFNHRMVREYLAAEWFRSLLQRQEARKAVENIFFKKQYDCDVIVPAMRPILSWVILFDDKIREKASRISPGILMQGGDPSQLPVEIRAQILSKLCQQYEEKDNYDLGFDPNTIKRFSHPDLGPAITDLLKKYKKNAEASQLLLQMVWRAEISSCATSALEIATDRDADIYARIYALRALKSVGTPTHIQNFKNWVVTERKEKDNQFLAEVIDTFGLDGLVVSEVCSLISRVPPPKRYEYSSLIHSMGEYISNVSIDHLGELIRKLWPLLRRKPLIERRACEISKNHIWLYGSLVSACERLIIARHADALSQPVISIIGLSTTVHDYDTYYSKDNKLHELVPAWQELNYRVFWHNLATARKYFGDKPQNRIIYWRQARVGGTHWKFNEVDFDLILSDIKKKANLDDKLVALSLAFQIYKDNGRKKSYRLRLKDIVKRHQVLEEALAQFLRPRMTVQEKKWKQSEANLKRQAEKRRQKSVENKAKWQDVLRKNIPLLRDNSLAEKGQLWNPTLYLMQRLRALDETNSNKWTSNNWQLLIPEFGREIAEAFREGAKGYWRRYSPRLRSDKVEDPTSIPSSVIYSLIGLGIEAQDVADWPSNLSSDEAKLACRYALLELNGFPAWLLKLYQVFPSEVLQVVLGEIEWEFVEYKGAQSCHYILSAVAWNADWLKPALSGPILNLLKFKNPKHDNTVREALGVALHEQLKDTTAIAELAKAFSLNDRRITRKALWFAVWMRVDGENALPAFDKYIGSIKRKSGATKFSMLFLTSLFGDRQRTIAERYTDFEKPHTLLRLYMLMDRHIRYEKDIERAGKGAYSPGLRDHAQEARNKFFNVITAIPGKPTYAVLMQLSRENPKRTWLLHQASKRAETDSDLEPWSSGSFKTFVSDFEREPRNNRELYDLVVSRLEDLRSDLEDGDDSIAETLKRITEETELRNNIAKWLQGHSRGRYIAPQESELANSQRPDIRIHGSGVNGAVPVELKIADNGWSGTQLFERLENQLCGDYLRDRYSNNGVYLLVFRGKKQTWEHPQTKVALSFQELILSLQEHAESYILDKDNIDQIKVIGIDLTLRAKKSGVP